MTSYVVITPPAAQPVSVALVKAHVHAPENGEDDTYLEELIKSASESLDGPAGWLGRALITQTIEARQPAFCGDIELRYPPIASVTSVKYDDNDGVEQTVSSGDYRLVGQPSFPRVALAYGKSWPSSRYQDEAVRVRYVAGYGAAWTDVPAPIRNAIMLMVGTAYLQRETIVIGQTVAPVPAAERMLAPYRIF